MPYDMSLITTIAMALLATFVILLILLAMIIKRWDAIIEAHGGRDLGAPLSRDEWRLFFGSANKEEREINRLRRQAFAQRHPEMISERTVKLLNHLEWLHRFVIIGLIGVIFCLFPVGLIAASLEDANNKTSGKKHVPAGLPERFEVIENLDNGDVHVRDSRGENACFLFSPGIWSHTMTYVPCEDLQK